MEIAGNDEDEELIPVNPTLSLVLTMVGGESTAKSPSASWSQTTNNDNSEFSFTARRRRKILIDMFQRMIDNNTVLGFPATLKRKQYTTTPILEAMMKWCDSCKVKKGGTISVAMVPPSLGKTTAARCSLKLNKAATRGIAICRHPRGRKPNMVDSDEENEKQATDVIIADDEPYVKSMLRLLLLNPEHPPNGWLSCLVEAFDTNTTDKDDPTRASNDSHSNNDKRQSFLILDDFESDPPDPTDHSFIMSLQAHLRHSHVHTILLTSSEAYANYLLSLNDGDHVGQPRMIRPLNGTITTATSSGAVPFPVPKACPPLTTICWNDMRWSVQTLHFVAREFPALTKIFSSQQQKQQHQQQRQQKQMWEEQIDYMIQQEIERYLQSLTEEQLRNLNPLTVYKVLQEHLLLPPGTTRMSPENYNLFLTTKHQQQQQKPPSKRIVTLFLGGDGKETTLATGTGNLTMCSGSCSIS